MTCSMKPTGDSRNGDLEGVLVAAAGELGLTLAEGELARFAIYKQELITWNRIIGLVAVKSPLDLPIKHFIDSLTALPLLPREGGRLLDIGTGAGFPGLPLKIIRTDLDLHLLEASRKKVSFLKELLRKLSLPGVTIIHERVEQVMKKAHLRASFDCVISRAAFKTPELLKIGLHFLRPGGLLLAMRGSREAGANLNSGHLVDIKGIIIDKIVDFRLPLAGVSRKIILYKKL
ncbi:MAG: Ribosomal small subunit methyltransferase [Thermodesulfobacteriota bacterium]|nr:Ribosomal small subunit methyltransferase [Thermodesulfobacteriota bacterium]